MEWILKAIKENKGEKWKEHRNSIWDIFKNKETRGFYRKQYGFWCMHILVAEEVNIQ